MAKYFNTVLNVFSFKLSYDLLNNLEQHANIDHNNDVDNHVNLATA